MIIYTRLIIGLRLFRNITRYLLFATSLINAAIRCSQIDVWHKMRNGNFEMVTKGSYQGTLKYMPHPGQFENLVNRYRREIEDNLDLLPLITKQCYTIQETLSYQYKFTWLDEDNGFLVLRYFAHIYNDRILAGYQILFVYDTDRNRLAKIFVSDVPLE